MRITILAYGSRGDVQPYVALGLGLERAGHQVTLAAPELFRGLADEYGLTFSALAGDPVRLMRAASNQSMATGWIPAPLRHGLTVAGQVRPFAGQLIADIRRACLGTDGVIHSLLTTVIGHLVAVELGIPDLSALVFPVFTPTCAFPNPLFPPIPGWIERLGAPAARFRSRYHFLTHREFSRMFWHAHRAGLAYFRRTGAAIPALEKWLFPWPDGILPGSNPNRPTPILYGISPLALPDIQDWAPEVHLTGYWFLEAPAKWQPDPGLVEFLSCGPPPVFVGFGSLAPRNAKRLATIAVEALEQVSCRGVLLSGWSGMVPHALSSSIYPIQEAPFDWLFPRVAAAVHHGGMGTTAAALRAGIPSVTVPFTFDQPFWGRQVAALGAGTKPIDPQRLNAENLAAAIRAALNNQELRKRAARLGAEIRQEDGVANAVRLAEKYLGAG